MKSNRLLYTLEVLLGIVLMGGVFLIAIHVDLRGAQRTLSSTVSYIKEQCNQYERLNLAAETKSMMRMLESVHQIDHALTDSINYDNTDEVTGEMLEQWARDGYVTGVPASSTAPRGQQPPGSRGYRFAGAFGKSHGSDCGNQCSHRPH